MDAGEFLASFQLKDAIPILLSVVSIGLSGATLWITQFRHGRLKMTQPTLLCLKREIPMNTPKIFLRTLLFTTGPQGRVVEAMFLVVHHPHEEFTFDFWGHTENGKLTLGSGLFIGSAGVASDHHFNPHRGSEHFLFVDGKYEIEVFAVVAGHPKPQKLMQLSFFVDGQQAAELIQITDAELFLLWNAKSHRYEGHVERNAKARSVHGLV